MQTGWAIWEWPNAFLRAEHHAVYEQPSGPQLIDITPSELPTVTRRLFLADDNATYNFENEGFRRNDRFKGLVSDPLVYEYFKLTTERNEILNSIPGVGMVSLTGDAATRYQANAHKIMMAEMQLAMNYTPQNAPCFCGSGAKFKHCHGRLKMK